MNGFLLIDKPSGWTSRDVCNKIQKILHLDKVGHTGTLDPFATGLLIVTIGKATKAGIYLEDDDKEYIASLSLGKRTVTGDLTSEVIEEKEVPAINKEDIEKIFLSFIGEQEQIPPMTSAIHYQGFKLYELAHQGIEVERKPRKIRINSLKLLDFKEKTITFSCSVSKGTYIRVLGEDIAKKLNTVGHLTSLRRVAIGHFDIKDSVPLLDVNEEDIMNMVNILSLYLKTIEVDEVLAKKIKDGNKLRFSEYPDYDKILLIHQGIALAIYEKENDDLYHCLRGLW